MRQLTAFIGKELLESIRTGKLVFLAILFILFGIMSPAIAKLTPWLVEMMSDSMTETGISVTGVEVNALTSWTQFYKNIPIALIVFLIMFSGILVQERQRGTLIPIITKGMQRWKIVASKGILLLCLWTAGYWLAFAITYCYNAYFWDNGIASHIVFSAICLYLLGLWLISLVVLFSTLLGSNSYVLLGTGGGFLISYLLGMLPKIEQYLPTKLFQCSGLLYHDGDCSDYFYAIAIALALSVINIIIAIICFNKRAI